MKIFTIPQKMSGTGSIHDIASDFYDRDIKFRKGEKYAVVLADFYGGGYTAHRSAVAAIKKSDTLTRDGYSHAIINTAGQQVSQDAHSADRLTTD